jgi:hypothetical protein
MNFLRWGVPRAKETEKNAAIDRIMRQQYELTADRQCVSIQELNQPAQGLAQSSETAATV